MRYFVAINMRGFFPSGEDTERFEVTEKAYDEILKIAKRSQEWIDIKREKRAGDHHE